MEVREGPRRRQADPQDPDREQRHGVDEDDHVADVLSQPAYRDADARWKKTKAEVEALRTIMLAANDPLALQTAWGLIHSCPLQRGGNDARMAPPRIVGAMADELRQHTIDALATLIGVPPSSFVGFPAA